MTIHHRKNFVAGVLFLLIGVGFAYASAQYRLGSAGRMGPGYFPLVLGCLLALLGSGVILGAVRGTPDAEDGGVIGAFNLRSLGAIVLATILFALLVRPTGLLVSVGVVAFVSSFATADARLRVAFFNVVIQMIIAYGVFHYLLGLQIPLLPPFLSL